MKLILMLYKQYAFETDFDGETIFVRKLISILVTGG